MGWMFRAVGRDLKLTGDQTAPRDEVFCGENFHENVRSASTEAILTLLPSRGANRKATASVFVRCKND